MANEIAKRDSDRTTVVLGVTNDASLNTSQIRVDPSTLRLLVNATLTGTSVVDNLGSTVYTGQKTVAVTNTAIAISTAQTIKNGVIVQALAANGANVVVGGSSVTTGTGFQLQAGQATSLAINDLSSVYVNGTAGDGVCFISTN